VAASSAAVGLAASSALRARARRQALAPKVPVTIIPKDAAPVHPVHPDPAA
jgi:hypothetical protein